MNTLRKHSGEVLDAVDSDWFTYEVSDLAGCVIEASASVTGGEAQLCAFGDLPNCEITCTTGTATNHEGYDGCCVVGANPMISWDTSCGIGEDASGTMYLEVIGAGAACLLYELSYRF